MVYLWAMEHKYCPYPASAFYNLEPDNAPVDPLANPVTRIALQAMLTGNKELPSITSGPVAAQYLSNFDRMGVPYGGFKIGPIA